MTSNLLIGYAEIPDAASLYLSSGTEDADHPQVNLVGGPRSEYFQLDANTGNVEVRFDLGSNVKAAEFLFIAGANLLKARGITEMILYSSSDGSSWTSRLGTASGFQTRTFTGPRSEDLMFTSSFNSNSGTPSASTFRYWGYSVNGATNKKPHRKAMLGTFFDFGRDPVWPRELEIRQDYSGARAPYYYGIFNWEGITDAKVQAFKTLMQKFDVLPVVLYTASYHPILDNHRTLFGHIVSARYDQKVRDSNDVTIVFEESV